MLEGFPVSARAATANLGRARQWYEDKLGLRPELEEGYGVWYRFGGDTWLYLYQTDAAGTARNTVAGWAVRDIETVMADLRARGVTFEEYDFGEMKTVDGILAMGGAKAAWFKDPDGNTYELTEKP
jgi:catechol 2,3-dioxygenase-like lactoylglutathione lyase family enzyme